MEVCISPGLGKVEEGRVLDNVFLVRHVRKVSMLGQLVVAFLATAAADFPRQLVQGAVLPN